MLTYSKKKKKYENHLHLQPLITYINNICLFRKFFLITIYILSRSVENEDLYNNNSISMDMSIQKMCGVTRIKTVKITFDWIIYNADLTGKKIGEFIDSPKFSASTSDKYKWFLRLYPKGVNVASKDHISLFLYIYIQGQDPNIEVKYDLSIINSKGEEENKTKEHKYHYQSQIGRGYDKFLQQQHLEKVLFNNKLIVRCNLTAGISIESCIIENPVIYDESKYQSKVHDDLEEFLKKNEFTDITLVASGKEFYAHKAILAARSPVFFTMLISDMKEKAESKIEFFDFDSNVLNEMLSYIYAGKVTNIDKYLSDLLFISDKYALEGLKDMCENHLYNKTSVINAVKTLALADKYNCNKLKNQVINFIISYRKEITDSSEFKMLKDSHPKLMCDVFLAITSKCT